MNSAAVAAWRATRVQQWCSPMCSTTVHRTRRAVLWGAEHVTWCRCYWLVAELPPILRLGSLGMMERAGCNDTQSKPNPDVKIVLASEMSRLQKLLIQKFKIQNALRRYNSHICVAVYLFNLIKLELWQNLFRIASSKFYLAWSSEM